MSTELGTLALSLTVRDVQAAADKAVRHAVTNLAAHCQDDPGLLAFLRELRPTSYHWIATRAEGEDPITGGHHSNFGEMRTDCEYLLGESPFPTVRRIDILDACGQIVWSKERA